MIGTTQVSSRIPIYNPGGFTDGDRGLYLCHHLADKNKEFILCGYQTGDLIGRYSKPYFTDHQPMTPSKKMKLDFCMQLIQNLRENHHRKIIFFENKILDAIFP